MIISRKLKCAACGELGEKSEMTQNDKKKYFHNGKCYEEHLEHIEFLKKEKEEWDILYQYLLKLHNILVLPKSNIIRLQGLRNGEDLRQGKVHKKYKMGASYELIMDAYLLAEESIKWCILNKLNGKNDTGAINYCITIMLGKLNEAWKHSQKVVQAKADNKRLNERIDSLKDVSKKMKDIQDELLKNKKINSNEIDITTLLD